ncbi:MAG: hypothetical protein Athens071426_693, partial [Parcubacteria group bacterium Athens0714_26]
MKRYKILSLAIDTSRGIFRGSSSEGSAIAIAKKEMENEIKSRFGVFEYDNKFKRYMALEKPVLSVVEEHTYLLEDICDAYVRGSLYSALTGACCLGERIFNNVIFKVMEDFKSSPWYKIVYAKNRRNGSIVEWEDGIKILHSWNIINAEVLKKYLRLKELRNESVHFQKKNQDLESMSLEAINIISFIISSLFSLDQNRKDILLWFDVPGEIFLKKAAENDPMVK